MPISNPVLTSESAKKAWEQTCSNAIQTRNTNAAKIILRITALAVAVFTVMSNLFLPLTKALLAGAAFFGMIKLNQSLYTEINLQNAILRGSNENASYSDRLTFLNKFREEYLTLRGEAPSDYDRLAYTCNLREQPVKCEIIDPDLANLDELIFELSPPVDV